jgi:hypothetical protein
VGTPDPTTLHRAKSMATSAKRRRLVPQLLMVEVNDSFGNFLYCKGYFDMLQACMPFVDVLQIF